MEKEILKKLELKILVVSPIYGGSLPTAKFTAQAFRKSGHTVEEFDSSLYQKGFLEIAKVTSNEEDTSILRTSYTNLLAEAIIAKTKDFKPDLLVALAQAPLTPSALQRLKKMAIPTAFWFVEDFRTLNYWSGVAPFYDYIFTIQKGDFFSELEKIGVKNYHYLPQAACPLLHKKLKLYPDEIKEFGSKISFMGAGYYNRQKFFLGLLGLDFKIWGTDWNAASPLFNKVQRNGGKISTDECVKIFNASPININLHSSSFHEGINPNGDFLNPRTFEIASCGAFQLVDERRFLPECFELGKEMIIFKDMDDLREKISYYSNHPEEREKIAHKARRRVLKDHTFEKRVEEMLLFITQKDPDRLEQWLEKKEPEVEKLIEEAGADSELGQYLVRFRGRKTLALADIVKDIEQGEGALEKPEVIFLMMNQFLTEKK